MPIAWSTQDLGGSVKIALSRDGGKTFQYLADEAPNSGGFHWPVTGPGSVNCMIEVVPIADTSKKALQGFFSILSTPFSLIYTAGPNGVIIGEEEQSVDHGSGGSPVKAEPDVGYLFVQWNDGLTENPRADAAVTSDISVTAVFHLRGDVTLDGMLDLGDAVLLLRHAAGLSELTDFRKKVGNVTGHEDHNDVGIADSIRILSFFVEGN